MRVVFFGSGPFATYSLKLLHRNFDLLCVVTTDNSEVMALAKKLSIKILTPENPNEKEFIDKIKSLEPDIICLTDYGHILSKELLSIPKIAPINLHPSLLPKYRGAAPIEWAILNGEKLTGVTTFIMDEKIDTGKILLQEKVEIKELETAGELTERLGKIGAELLIKTMKEFKNIKQKEQTGEPSYAPKIKKEMRKIEWNSTAKDIVNKIRALTPKYPAYTIFRNKRIEILLAKVEENLTAEVGKILIDNKRLLVGTKDNCIEIMKLKPEGKKEQTGLDFINGYRPKQNELFE